MAKLGRHEAGQVLKAWESGPPREAVGLEPFAPPEYLTGYGAGPVGAPGTDRFAMPDTTAAPR